MYFSKALKKMRKGESVKLSHWGDDVSIQIQTPDEYSKMSAPYIYVSSRFGCVPWGITQIELLSDDWEVVSLWDGLDDDEMW